VPSHASSKKEGDPLACIYGELLGENRRGSNEHSVPPIRRHSGKKKKNAAKEKRSNACLERFEGVVSATSAIAEKSG